MSIALSPRQTPRDGPIERPPESAPAFIELEGFSEEALSAFIPMSSSEHVQIGRGKLTGSISLLPLQDGALRRVNFSIAMRFVGTVRPDVVSLVFAQNASEETRVCGVAVRSGALLTVDSRVCADASLPPGVVWTGLRLSRPAYLDAWSASTERDPPWPASFGMAIASAPARAALDDLIGQAEAMARGRPDLFDAPLWRGNVQRALLDRFIGALVDATECDDPPAHVRKPAADIVRLVEEYLAACNDPASVPEICAALGVRRRTLERAFADGLGCSPRQYLKVRALGLVRDALLDPERLDDSITSIAMEHGFWHLGRFSAFYRDHFLETPTETRRALVRRVAPEAGLSQSG